MRNPANPPISPTPVRSRGEERFGGCDTVRRAATGPALWLRVAECDERGDRPCDFIESPPLFQIGFRTAPEDIGPRKKAERGMNASRFRRSYALPLP